MEDAGDGGALDDGVLGEVVEGEQGAAFVEGVDQFMGDFAVVEVVGIGGDVLKGAGQLGLAEGLAFHVMVAVALEDAFGVREAGKVGIGKLFGLLGGEDEAVGGELDGGSDDALEA